MPAAPREPALSVLGSAWTETSTEAVTGRWPRRTRTREVDWFRDWLVDGRPLRERASIGHSRADDRPLMWGPEAGDAVVVASLRALLAEEVGPDEEWVRFPDGRTAILFCGLCGDIWCGAISADVRVEESIVEWRDVAYQDRITGEIAADRPPFTLRFERGPYERTIRELITGWR